VHSRLASPTHLFRSRSRVFVFDERESSQSGCSVRPIRSILLKVRNNSDRSYEEVIWATVRVSREGIPRGPGRSAQDSAFGDGQRSGRDGRRGRESTTMRSPRHSTNWHQFGHDGKCADSCSTISMSCITSPMPMARRDLHAEAGIWRQWSGICIAQSLWKDGKPCSPAISMLT